LRDAGFDAYVPQFQLERFNRQKRIRVVSTHCLFPGYLFAEIAPDRFRAARACKGVLDLLPGFPHEPVPISAAIVTRLREAQERGDLDDTDAARRKRGETTKNTLAAMRKRLRGKTIRIKDGPFEGLPAEVEVIPSFDRIGVLVSIFGRPTSVTLEMDQVEEMAA
jgi:transcriptional antiterminator NusG